MTRQTQAELRRRLPSVDRVLRHPPIESLCEQHGRRRVRDWIREVLDEFRKADQTVCDAPTGEPSLDAIAGRCVDRAVADVRSGLQPVVNGTGVVLQTNLGRAPLAQAAIDAINDSARSCNVEFNLETGRRGRRGETVEGLWSELTGAEAALVVNNCAAATLLALRTLAAGHEVILSRGQLIEIGGSYRLPDVFVEAGVTLREVGTTNRTHLSDYQRALSEQTRAILRVHSSNFRQTGFTHSVPAAELAELAHENSLPFVDDVGSGCAIDLSRYGWTDEPTIEQSLKAGADLVLFSGDKLFGGPQCGVILGSRELVDRLRSSPLTRALRVDKMTLAALEATLRIYLAGRAVEEIPVLRAIAQPFAALRERADRLQREIRASGTDVAVDVETLESVPGGGSLPGETLASCGLVLRVSDCDDVARLLRVGSPSVVTRVRQNAVCIDLRSVAPEEDELLLQALKPVLTSGQGQP